MSLDPCAIPLPAPSAPVTCPECGAKLLSVSAERGAIIRCLNCGVKFIPHPATDATAANLPFEAASAHDMAEPIREPRSAGYWFLRLPAIVYFVAATLVFCIWIASLVGMFYNAVTTGGNVSNRAEQTLMGLMYLPLFPLSGYFAFITTRSLARLEKYSLKAAWNAKLLQSPLPVTPGSSLPHILPLAVGPVVIFIATAVLAQQNYGWFGGTFPAGIAGLGCFMLGFMIDDFRQFLWRQKSLADACAKHIGVSTASPEAASFPWLALLPALTVSAFALMFGCIFIEQYQQRSRYQYADRDQLPVQLLIVLTMLICALPFYLTGKNFLIAAQSWRKAAARALRQDLTEGDIPTKRVRTALFVFAAAGAVTVFYNFFRLGQSGSDMVLPIFYLILTFAFIISFFVICLGCSAQPKTLRILTLVLFTLVAGWAFVAFIAATIPTRVGYSSVGETIGFLLAIGGGVLLCALLAQIYADVRRWRAAQAAFWNVPAPATLSKTPSAVAIGTVVLVGIQSIFFTFFMFHDMYRGPLTWDELAALPLLLFMAHFPTIWVLLVTREFILAEETAAKVAQQ